MEGTDISCVPSAPTYAQFPPLSTSSPTMVHCLQLMNLHWHIGTTQNPSFRVHLWCSTCYGLRHVFMMTYTMIPRWHGGKESICQCRRCKRCKFNPWLRRIPWSRKWRFTLVFLPGKFHGQRSLGGQQSMGSQRVGHNWVTEHSHDDMYPPLSYHTEHIPLCICHKQINQIYKQNPSILQRKQNPTRERDCSRNAGL